MNAALPPATRARSKLLRAYLAVEPWLRHSALHPTPENKMPAHDPLGHNLAFGSR